MMKLMLLLMLVLLLVLLLLGGITASHMRHKEDRALLSIVRRLLFETRWLRLPAALLALLLTGVFSFVYVRNDAESAELLVTLNYAEAYRGQNTNGSRYNMSEIVSDEVIELAIEKGAMEDVTVQQLSQCLSVMPVIQGDSFAEEAYHVSTEFIVTFTQSKDTEHLDAKKVVQMIGHAYKEFYIDHYVEDFRALNVSVDYQALEDMDYMDIREALGLQADQIANYMYALADKNSSFTSSDGETFLSIASKCNNVKNVLIDDNFLSYLLQNGVSKDRRGYISRLSYDNTRYDFEYRKAKASFEVCNAAVSRYAEEMLRIVLVPTWDGDGEYYMGRTKVGIDELSTQAETFSQKAAQLQKSVETNSATISAMSSSGKSGKDGYAEAMVETIGNDISLLAQMAYRAGREYSETRLNQCITLRVQDSSFLIFAALGAGYFMMSYLAFCVLMQKNKVRGKGM